MDWYQLITLLAGIIISGIAGFGWLINRMDKKFDMMNEKFDQKFEHIELRINQVESKIGQLDNRLTVIETILAMMGAPIKGFKHPSTDP